MVELRRGADLDKLPLRRGDVLGLGQELRCLFEELDVFIEGALQGEDADGDLAHVCSYSPYTVRTVPSPSAA